MQGVGCVNQPKENPFTMYTYIKSSQCTPKYVKFC